MWGWDRRVWGVRGGEHAVTGFVAAKVGGLASCVTGRQSGRAHGTEAGLGGGRPTASLEPTHSRPKCTGES